MRKKDLERARGLSRRRTLQGLGAVLGTAAAGCGGDGAAAGGTDGGSSSGTGSTTGPGGTSTSTGVGTSSSTGGAEGTTSGGTSSTGAGESSSSTTGPADECSASDLPFDQLFSEIDTIVVVMMENRSFDHYFGSATFLEGWTVDGLTGDETNNDLEGNAIQVYALDDLQTPDPPHSWQDSHLQWDMGANDGFVMRNEVNNPDTADEVMGYHVRAQLPVLYALADGFTLCDKWHASVMGPTWPNRFYLHCGTSGGQQGNSPETGLSTIWGQLDDAGISHKNYYSDVPWVWGGFANPLVGYTTSIDNFFNDAQAGTLPQFSIIDPSFGTLGGGGNDDHPPHDISLGQIFLASVYQAIAASPQWNSCLLVITYDEHGGFFDHVSPPVAPDDNPDFQRFGFRVPTLVIGPHVRQACINGTLFDHTTILNTVSKKFGLTPLTTRVEQANDLSSCINPDYLGHPQPPIQLPQMVASKRKLLQSHEGSNQPELKAMIDAGIIPIPPENRVPNPGVTLNERLLKHARRLGVVKLLP